MTNKVAVVALFLLKRAYKRRNTILFMSNSSRYGKGHRPQKNRRFAVLGRKNAKNKYRKRPDLGFFAVNVERTFKTHINVVSRS
jgi:hypothetical protein